MRLRKICTIGCLLVSTALAQTEDALRSRIATVHYSPFAEHARIQGDVRLQVTDGLVRLVSGHPLLAPLAIENAKTFGSTQGQPSFDVTYHFVLVDTSTHTPATMTVKRGNAFERAVLRVFGFKTEEVVQFSVCESGVAPPNNIKTDGAVIEIWVHGRILSCPEPDAAALVATC